MSTPADIEEKGPAFVELAPCPACDSKVIAVGLLAEPLVKHGAQATCGSCGMCGPERSGGQAAAEAWNALPRRSPVSSSTGDDLVERLRCFAGITPDHPSGGSFLNETAFVLVSAAASRIATLEAALDLAVSRGCDHCADSIRRARSLTGDKTDA